MSITNPTQTNYLYRLEYGGNIERWTNVAENQSYNGEIYRFMPVEHTSPKFSAEAQDAEIDLSVHEANPISSLFTFGPPPYPIKLRIYEYDRVAQTAEPRYRGWIIRPSFDLTGSLTGFRCKSVWHFYERESFTDSLSKLSRFSIYDPRAGIDIESLRTGITVSAFNDERDVLTVTGITQLDAYFSGGLIAAPDRDMRTILKHETVGANKQLTLSAAFPRFTLDVGFTADIYPGDDLTYETWANKFAAESNNGEKWGGWQYTPNVDPNVRGVI